MTGRPWVPLLLISVYRGLSSRSLFRPTADGAGVSSRVPAEGVLEWLGQRPLSALMTQKGEFPSMCITVQAVSQPIL
jgi:hypothetical protein